MHSFNAKVTEFKHLTADTIFISLAAPSNFTFLAGQFIIITIKKGTEIKPRSYSILNPPLEKGKIDLGIKLVKGGFASEVFANCKKDDVFAVKGPCGSFLFNENTDTKEHWFICTGTGIVPLLSIIKEYLPQYPSKKFKLFWGLKTRQDLYFQDELKQLAQEYPNFSYLISLSREKYSHTGHIQDHLGANLKDKIFYLCGLKDFILETKELLEHSGVDKDKIKFQRYS